MARPPQKKGKPTKTGAQQPKYGGRERQQGGLPRADSSRRGRRGSEKKKAAAIETIRSKSHGTGEAMDVESGEEESGPDEPVAAEEEPQKAKKGKGAIVESRRATLVLTPRSMCVCIAYSGQQGT